MRKAIVEPVFGQIKEQLSDVKRSFPSTTIRIPDECS
jgi:hypothetical protein